MMNNNLKLTTLCIALIGAAGANFAQATEKRAYVGVDAGKAEARKYCDNAINCKSGDTSARAEVGFQFNDMFAAELGYTSFGTLVNSKDTNAFNAKQDASAWTASVLAGWPLAERFGLYGRAGIAAFNYTNSGTIQGVPVKNDNSTKPYFGLGLSFGLNDDWSLRAEYQRYTDISGVNGSNDSVQGWYGGGVYRF